MSTDCQILNVFVPNLIPVDCCGLDVFTATGEPNTFIECDENSRVITLYMSDHGDAGAGSLPPDFGSLNQLRELWIKKATLSGELPTSIGGLVNLEVLVIQSTNLLGQIPESIGQASKLRVVSLDDNSLTGVLPESFGDLMNLQALLLGGNQISGIVPESLSNLSELQYMYVFAPNFRTLNDNAFEGVLPDLSLLPLSGGSVLNLTTSTISGQTPSLPVCNFLNSGLCLSDTNFISASCAATDTIPRMQPFNFPTYSVYCARTQCE